jgi:two-component system sensor histidine kinase KdpD
MKAAVSSLRNDDISWSPEDEASLLETIEESVDRLDALVSNLLDMSRLATGTLSPHVDPLDLGSVVQRAVASCADGTRVDISIDEDVPTIAADAGLLERVIGNLVENALRHGTPDGQVRVDAAAAGGDRVVLRVIDDGEGVPAESKETMFEPFQRLGDVPKGDGVGLGLAVARGLVEAMGGTLTAEDTPAGGLTAVLDLPIARDET